MPKSPKSPKTKETTAQAYKKYYQVKELAKVLEKQNNSKLIVFPSLETKGKKDEWLKLGGNSALFYKYYVAPRLGKNPKINPDTDHKLRFNDGVITPHWKHLFIENLKTLNYEPKEENGLLIIDLDHTFTEEEIKSLKNREKEERVKANRLIVPEVIKPKLYAKLITLAKIIPFKAAKLPDPYKNSLGKGLNQAITEMLIIYTLTADGQINEASAKTKLLQAVAKISAILIILNETKLFDVETENQLGHILAELKMEINHA